MLCQVVYLRQTPRLPRWQLPPHPALELSLFLRLSMVIWYLFFLFITWLGTENPYSCGTDEIVTTRLNWAKSAKTGIFIYANNIPELYLGRHGPGNYIGGSLILLRGPSTWENADVNLSQLIKATNAITCVHFFSVHTACDAPLLWTRQTLKRWRYLCRYRFLFMFPNLAQH